MVPKAEDALPGLSCMVCLGVLADGPFMSPSPPGCLRSCLGSRLGRWGQGLWEALSSHGALGPSSHSLVRLCGVSWQGPGGCRCLLQKHLGGKEGGREPAGPVLGQLSPLRPLVHLRADRCSPGIGVSVLSHGKPQGSWSRGCLLHTYKDVL